MSNRHRLVALRKRIETLQQRIERDQRTLSGLQDRACFLSARIAVEEMPVDRRDALLLGSLSTNRVARKPVVRKD